MEKFKVLIEPFENYLSNISAWEETDFIAKLCDYLEVPNVDKVLFVIQFKKMLVRIVAGAMNIDYANIWAFVFVHQDQEDEISSFLKWLCPAKLSDFYAEKDELDQRGLITSADHFIINLKGLSTYSQEDINLINNLIKCHYIGCEATFDNQYNDYKKVASFLGSTENIDFLRDYEENIQWICYELKNINSNYKMDIDINKIWGQAFTLYKRGFNYRPTKTEMNEIKELNAELLSVTA